MRHLKLSAVDTYFFRDGRPFSAELGFQFDIGSVFPPHPPTIVGCLRAALALERGWDGKGDWGAELKRTLGDGLDLGKLRFAGPYLLQCSLPLFPVPRHLLQRKSDRRRVLLRPGEEIRLCDLGTVMQAPEFSEPPPEGDASEYKNLSVSALLNVEQLNAVLRGEKPEGEIRENLWAEEPRIGLERDAETGTAKEEQLYSTRHVRPGTGLSLGVSVEGVDGWSPPGWTPLGGEGRATLIEDWDGKLGLDQPLDRVREGKFVAIAMTPLDLRPEALRPGGHIEEVNATVVSMCLDRPVRIGGWDFRGGPLPLRNYVAPGGVLFCDGDVPAGIEAQSPIAIGGRTEWGFGRVALGVWPGERTK